MMMSTADDPALTPSLPTINELYIPNECSSHHIQPTLSQSLTSAHGE
jgi:hypothetical protein